MKKILFKGLISDGGEESDVLLNAKINIFPNKYCQSSNYGVSGLTDGRYQLCAGVMDGNLFIILNHITKQ